ncbi:MAG TPA: NADPH-dependent FMN reductase [Candidatus Saccharimonadales bacterium]
MKILILSGSVGKKSCTRTLLRCIEERLELQGYETVFWDLAIKPLPIIVPEYHSSQGHHPDKNVREFVALVEEADGFVLGSPLYHGSYTGVLKNALDTLPRDALAHKPVGLASHSSNPRSCIAPCNQLRPVVRALSGYSIQLQIGTTDEDYKTVKGDLAIRNQKVTKRVDRLVNELLVMSRILHGVNW